MALRGPLGVDGYLLGSYRSATAPEPNSAATSFKSTRFDSPANNVGSASFALLVRGQFQVQFLDLLFARVGKPLHLADDSEPALFQDPA